MKDTLRRLLAASARVAQDPAVVAPLVASTGLSRENVVLGLSRHLETSATDAELDALARSVRPTARTHIILSPSVFVAPLRAIALGLAASPLVTVKPSRREAFFAQALIEAFGNPRARLTQDTPNDVREGEIHAYGSDATIAAIRATARVPVRGHATGLGIAVVTGDLDQAARAVADDVVPFDQRGCLSPRVVFVASHASTFAKKLFDALESSPVPRGELDPVERAEARRWQDTVTFAGELHRGQSCAVGLLETLALPPTGRHVLVVPGSFRLDVGLRPHLVAVGTDDPALVVPPGVRRSPLGMMQRPPLDGPVDRRDLAPTCPKAL